MLVYEAIARAVAEQRVPAVFGLMGDGNLKLIPCLVERHEVAFYASRHEGGAVSMAEGYAKMSGGVGVVTFTQGPGLTNALTALISAHRNRTPLVVLAGDTPSGVPGLVQEIEQEPILDAVDLAYEPLTPATASRAVATAFARAVAERRPVVLNLPTDVQDEPCEWVEPAAAASPAAAPAPREDELAAAVAAIAAAERPVLVAGRGAVLDGARAPITALADRIGALLATSLQAKGWFGAHPYALGIAGGFSTPLGFELIHDADCIVVFGASLNHFTSRGGRLFAADATIVQCDVDPSAFGRFTRADVTVTGSAAAVATALTTRLDERAGYRDAELAERLAAHARERVDESEPAAIDPRALSSELDDLLPADRALVLDGGHYVGFPAQRIAVEDPSDFLFTLGFGSIGLGLPAAIGAAVARPDRVTVAAVGDGGLMMSLGELDTAARYRLPLLIVVYNDAAYGAELHFLRMLGIRDDESRFVMPPLDEIARAVGVDGATATTLDELRALRDRFGRLERPLLVDCRISEEIRADWIAEAFERAVH